MSRSATSLTVIKKIIGDAPFLFEGSFPDGVAYAKKLGYDCVEIHVTTPDELKDPELMESLEKNQIRVSALGTGRLYVNAGLSLTDDDPAIRAKAISQLKEFIDAAEKMHSLVILGCVRGNIPRPKDREKVLELLGGSMRELDKYALAHSVTMVFEPINRYENNYLCNTYEIADFLRKNDLKNIKMMIDTFHMNIEEVDIRQSIIDNIDDIAYAHFADSNRWYPGKGHLDFPMILKTLIDHGYNGVISAECLPLPTKEEASIKWLAAVKELLKEYD
jgi:Sugar phosphate isomerases/epimerases